MPERMLPPARIDTRDVRFGPVLAASGLLALALAVVLLGALLLFPDTMTDQFVAQPLPRFAEPRLQSSPRADMDKFRADQMHELNTAYWLDRQHDVVHLPIATAMRKVADEGIADWPAPKQAGK